MTFGQKKPSKNAGKSGPRDAGPNAGAGGGANAGAFGTRAGPGLELPLEKTGYFTQRLTCRLVQTDNSVRQDRRGTGQPYFKICVKTTTGTYFFSGGKTCAELCASQLRKMKPGTLISLRNIQSNVNADKTWYNLTKSTVAERTTGPLCAPEIDPTIIRLVALDNEDELESVDGADLVAVCGWVSYYDPATGEVVLSDSSGSSLDFVVSTKGLDYFNNFSNKDFTAKTNIVVCSLYRGSSDVLTASASAMVLTLHEAANAVKDNSLRFVGDVPSALCDKPDLAPQEGRGTKRAVESVDEPAATLTIKKLKKRLDDALLNRDFGACAEIDALLKEEENRATRTLALEQKIAAAVASKNYALAAQLQDSLDSGADTVAEDAVSPVPAADPHAGEAASSDVAADEPADRSDDEQEPTQ